MTTARRISRISFTASNLDDAEDFYAQLGFAPVRRQAVEEPERVLLGLPRSRAERLVMRIGGQEIEFLSFDPPGRPYPQGSTATDGWFQHIAIVVADMAEAYERVLIAGATAITIGPPQTLPPNTGQVTAYKFRDPDGHPLELLAFPPGAGAPIWHELKSESPFLGIDHTAIVVQTSARSEAFYENLGLKLDSRTLNRGPGQSHLDAVDDDVAQVVALTLPGAPPHLELLDYGAGARRPMPADLAANDVAATRTVLDVDRLADSDRERAVALADASRALLVVDPDGHRLVLHERIDADD